MKVKRNIVTVDGFIASVVQVLMQMRGPCLLMKNRSILILVIWTVVASVGRRITFGRDSRSGREKVSIIPFINQVETINCLFPVYTFLLDMLGRVFAKTSWNVSNVSMWEPSRNSDICPHVPPKSHFSRFARVTYHFVEKEFYESWCNALHCWNIILLFCIKMYLLHDNSCALLEFRLF